MTPIDPGVRTYHVRPRVADLVRAPGLHRDLPGFVVTPRMGDPAGG